MMCLTPHFGNWKVVALQEVGALSLDRLQEAVYPHLLIRSSQSTAALLVHSDFACNLTWYGSGSCCSAVTCRLDGKLHLFASAYLPHSGHGNDAYEAALEDVRLLLRAAPNTHHLWVGLDANLSLSPDDHRSMLRTVGPLCWSRRHADSAGSAGFDLRRQAFLSFLTASNLCPLNTFLSSDNLSPEWTHRPYAHPTRKAQIDFVLGRPSDVEVVAVACRVIYDVDCRSDHKPLLMQFRSMRPHLPSVASQQRRRPFTKGWQPSNLTALATFQEKACQSLSRKPSIGDLSALISEAARAVPHTTLRNRDSRQQLHVQLNEDLILNTLRTQLASLIPSSVRHKIARSVFRRKMHLVAAFRKSKLIQDAQHGCRPGKFLQASFSALALPDGSVPTTDQTAWPDLICQHVRNVFAADVDPDDHDAWFAGLERQARDADPLDFPLATLIQARARLKKGKQVGGFLGLASEMIIWLPYPVLFYLRSLFEDRLNARPEAAAEVED